MNALLRWWRNLTLPSPVSTARNHVSTEFLVGATRLEMWRECMAEATRMRERGVNEPWLMRYLEACKDEIARLSGHTEPETDV